MAQHARFSYHTLEQLRADLDRLDLALPTCDDIDVLAKPARFGSLEVPNRLAVHPMEGCDGLADGAPSDLIFRRYRRFGAGGVCASAGESLPGERVGVDGGIGELDADAGMIDVGSNGKGGA